MSQCSRRYDCRLCHAKELDLALHLTPTPPANAFVTEAELKKEQELFPLDVYLCRRCKHAQLLDVVDPSILFRNYVYVSGTSPIFVEHFGRYADYLCQEFGLGSGQFVLDIGSNDGTLLRFFKQKGMNVLGVDPAVAIAKRATQEGIETWAEFFDSALATQIQTRFGKASAIVANNVFAHIDNLDEVVRGVKSLLDPARGTFTFEVSYLVDVLEKNLFDTIYHEHLCYHSLTPLISFFEGHGMEVIDALRVDSHGGSLRVVTQIQGGTHFKRKRVQELLDLEKKAGALELTTFRRFNESINSIGRELRELLVNLKSSGKRVAGFGAPAKATTLMYHFGIGPDLIDFIVDDSPLKQGLYSPGFHIPVVSSQLIDLKRPDYLLILAWNFAESIMKKNERHSNSGGKFIIPFPQVKVV